MLCLTGLSLWTPVELNKTKKTPQLATDFSGKREISEAPQKRYPSVSETVPHHSSDQEICDPNQRWISRGQKTT